MSELPYSVDDIDYDLIATEDDEPVDNLHSEREQRLLVDSLYASWQTKRKFVAMSNVGMFYHPKKPPYVPDTMISMDVTILPHPKPRRFPTYFIWQYGKPPDLVVEIVSNIERHEERKIREYARLGIGYYVIHDPGLKLSRRELRVYELHGARYVEMLGPGWISTLALGMKLWEGDYQGFPGSYLRWCDAEGNLLRTGEELAVDSQRQLGESERQLGESERKLSEAERSLEEERLRVARLEARLRELEP